MRLPLKTFSLIGVLALLGGAAFWLASDRNAPDPEPVTKPELGLMTSLPLYWPIGVGVDQIASGDFEQPWAREQIEERFLIRPLDTLSPMPGLGQNDPEIDPLEGLSHLAVIQPRGLSPADNVALDQWVRSGGTLLIALDPALTGHYPVSFADPRHPALSVAIPPVIDRWGLAIAYEDHTGHDHALEVSPNFVDLGDGKLPVQMPGVVAIGEDADCIIAADQIVVRCTIGEGVAVIVADAAVFEFDNGDGAIENLLAFAFGAA